MANVLILSLVFPPDGVSTAQLMGELAEDLNRSGHEVTVLTTMPHYNRDVDAEARQPIHRNALGIGRSSFRGVRVIHAPMPAKTASVPLRLLAWIQFHVLSTAIGALLRTRPDVIIAPSPPLTIGLSAWLLGIRHGVRFIYNVQEVYPDVAIGLGMLKNRPLIRALQRLERFVYSRSRFVTVIGQGMRSRILGKGVAREKVLFIPNFVDVDQLRPAPRDNAFAREHSLGGRFVVCYAGNMGPAQGLEILMDAAERLRDDPEVVFVLIGSGTSRQRLKERAAAAGLGNVKILEHLPYTRVPEIYGTADLCVVPQIESIGADAAPSKVYRIMACARPVLALTGPESDLAALVGDAQCGMIVPPGDAAEVAAAIRRAARERSSLERMGRAGREYVESHFTRVRITGMYNDLIERAMR